MIYFTCTRAGFIPHDSAAVRWLDRTTDYELARTYWLDLGHHLRHSTWDKAHEYGYQYAALIANGRIVSSAAKWHFAEEYYDVAAVITLEQYRRRGHAKKVVAFVTDYILNQGKTPTCSAQDENYAMIATAKSVGFQEIPPNKVKWSYPRLPAF